MSKDSDAIDQVFQLHEEAKRERTQSQKLDQIRVGTSRLTREEQIWADAAEAETQPGSFDELYAIYEEETQPYPCI